MGDHPGWYKRDGRLEDQSKSFSMLRKPDGTVNVAYDGSGGCNHRPGELELIRENEPDFMPQQ